MTTVCCSRRANATCMCTSLVLEFLILFKDRSPTGGNSVVFEH